jgi:hypothetical protein
MRAIGVRRRDRVRPRRASTLASLRTNDRRGTFGPKFVGAWIQLPLEVPVGRVRHCRAVVAHVVASGGRADRNEGLLAPSRRTQPPVPREVESRSSLPRRASGRGSRRTNRSDDGGTLERVLHSVQRPKILGSCSWHPGAEKRSQHRLRQNRLQYLVKERCQLRKSLVSLSENGNCLEIRK